MMQDNQNVVSSPEQVTSFNGDYVHEEIIHTQDDEDEIAVSQTYDYIED